MKKILGICLTIVLCFIFTSCQPTNIQTIDNDNTTTQSNITSYNYEAFSELPRIDINTENGIAIDDESLIDPDAKKGVLSELPVYNYVNSQISVSNCEGYELNNVNAQVKVRGNYSSSYPKKPIRIKFNKKQAMCGLNSGKKLKSWVLLAEYKDISMLRNCTAFYLGTALLESEGYYVSDFRYVEVYINGDYNGLYLLAEQQQVNENRVNLPEALDPSDFNESELTDEEYNALHSTRIGYFIEYDGYYFHENPLVKFNINYKPIQALNHINSSLENAENVAPLQNYFHWCINLRDVGFSISNDIYYEEQRDFIAKCMQTIWNCIYDAFYNDHNDPIIHPYHTMDNDGNYVEDRTINTSYEAVAKIVDIKSLVNMYILQELCMDADIAWSSFYFSLDMSENGNHLLTYTAPWDFDSGLGNLIDAPANDYNFVCNYNNPWLSIYTTKSWFWELVKQRWDEIIEFNLRDKTIAMLEFESQTFMNAYEKNYEKWQTLKKYTGEITWENHHMFYTELEASRHLQNWIRQRFDNIDKNINNIIELFARN